MTAEGVVSGSKVPNALKSSPALARTTVRKKGTVVS